MNAVQVLRLHADVEFEALLEGLDGVEREQSWAVAPLKPGEHFHNNGSILGVVQHVAGCKLMYGSAAFRNLEVRWRDVSARLAEIGSDWQRTLEYLRESDAYWRDSWNGLTDEDLSSQRRTNWGESWPAWKIISCITAHDAYHAGQIVVLRATLPPTNAPPESMAELTRKYLSDSPSW